MVLVRAIAASDADTVSRMLEASPALARASVEVGATREEAAAYYLDEIDHYVYAGDTALHIAAAAYAAALVSRLLELGADVGARNHGAPSRCTMPPTGSPARTPGTRPHRRRSSRC